MSMVNDGEWLMMTNDGQGWLLMDILINRAHDDYLMMVHDTWFLVDHGSQA